MSKLNFEYVPLTFINDKEEIKKQVRNTLILIYLFEKYNNPVRLEKLIEGTQYGFNASALQSGKNKFLRISDIYESKVDWETVPYCNCDDEKTYLLKDEDILIARTGGTTGKSFKIQNPPKHSIYAGYLIRIRAKSEVNPDYIYLFLHSFAYWSQIVNLNERNFRPKANAENLKALILPDCPKDVQDEVVRIAEGENVKGYEDLFAEIEKALGEYDKARKVEELLSEQLMQIENLSHAIVQEAVQGKLVKQDKKDEPANELLKCIKAEKAKSGKKEKPLPPIKPEEIPFEIPNSWIWCRLGEISEIKRGKGPKYSEKGVFKMLNQKCIRWYKVDLQFCKSVDLNWSKSVSDDFKVSVNDVLVNSTGDGTIGRSAIAHKEVEGYIFDSHILKISSIINQTYICYYINSNYGQEQVEKSKGATSTKQHELGVNNLSHFTFPLPPLLEQKRIVTEIESQFAKIKQVKEHIINNQQATEQLLKALLHRAFEVKEMQEV